MSDSELSDRETLIETNAILRSIEQAMSRQAHALEQLLLHVFSVAMMGEGVPESVEDLPPSSPEFRDDDLGAYEDTLAAIEILEQEGYMVPEDTYKRLGIDPPRPVPDDPEPESSEINEPPTARKDLT